MKVDCCSSLGLKRELNMVRMYVDLRLRYHVSLKNHFVELAIAADEGLLRLWKVKSPIDKVSIDPINDRVIRHDRLPRT